MFFGQLPAQVHCFMQQPGKSGTLRATNSAASLTTTASHLPTGDEEKGAPAHFATPVELPFSFTANGSHANNRQLPQYSAYSQQHEDYRPYSPLHNAPICIQQQQQQQQQNHNQHNHEQQQQQQHNQREDLISPHIHRIHSSQMMSSSTEDIDIFFDLDSPNDGMHRLDSDEAPPHLALKNDDADARAHAIPTPLPPLPPAPLLAAHALPPLLPPVACTLDGSENQVPEGHANVQHPVAQAQPTRKSGKRCGKGRSRFAQQACAHQEHACLPEKDDACDNDDEDEQTPAAHLKVQHRVIQKTKCAPKAAATKSTPRAKAAQNAQTAAQSQSQSQLSQSTSTSSSLSAQQGASKNVVKIFCIAFMRYMSTYRNQPEKHAVFTARGVTCEMFLQYAIDFRSKIFTIKQLRAFLEDGAHLDAHTRALNHLVRAFCFKFLREHALQYFLANTRIHDRFLYMRYIRVLQRALVNPNEFSSLKDED